MYSFFFAFTSGLGKNTWDYLNLWIFWFLGNGFLLVFFSLLKFKFGLFGLGFRVTNNQYCFALVICYHFCVY